MDICSAPRYNKGGQRQVSNSCYYIKEVIIMVAGHLQEKEIRKVSIIEFDEKWFNGKQVLCFDDIITRGHSYANYANQLESMGANVIGGMFLARTHYRTNV